MEPEYDRKPVSYWRKEDLLRTPKVVAAGLLRTPKAAVEQAVAVQVYGRMVEVVLDPACGAMAEAAAPSSVAGEGLMALLSGAGPARVP